jgi:hypothetical protein
MKLFKAINMLITFFLVLSFSYTAEAILPMPPVKKSTTAEPRQLYRKSPTAVPLQQLRNFATRSPCISGSGEYPIPRITSWGPEVKHYKGLDITFNGTNFIPDKFKVCLGNQLLTITSSSTNKIIAKLPSTPTTGRLVVSHGTSNSLYPLAESYIVFGDPIISQVSPVTFNKGDIVTIQGRYLFGVYALQTQPNTAQWLIKISNSASSYGKDFLSVWDWNQNQEGTQITFRASGIYEVNSYDRSKKPLVPQPMQLTGQLRLWGGADVQNQFTITGPTVTWRAPSLSITNVEPPAWGNSIPNFIIAKEVTSYFDNPIIIRGTDLNQSSFKVGGADVFESCSAHGQDCRLTVSPSTPSGYITAEKNGLTVQSAGPVKIIPAPAFLPGTVPSEPSPWVIRLDQVVEMRGWDLQPIDTPGLAYNLRLLGDGDAVCKIDFVLIEHSPSVMKFKVARTGPTPDACLQSTLFGHSNVYRLARFVATYNSFERELWSKKFYLTP